MRDIVNLFTDTGNSTLTFILLCLAVFRIYLEVIDFDFSSLPIGRQVAKVYGQQHVGNFHRYGFYLSVGYLILFAPTYLLYS
jgi:hypothetical protein